MTDNMKPTTIITGTGRAGTSFLVQLLTMLGVDTGFSDPYARWDRATNSGMEIHISNRKWAQLPRVVKDPTLSTKIRELHASGFLFERVIVPIRPLSECVQSRIDKNVKWFGVPMEVARMNTHLGFVLGTLVADLVTLDIPYTFIKYPLLVESADYCRECLGNLVSDIDEITFREVFSKLSFAEKR